MSLPLYIYVLFLILTTDMSGRSCYAHITYEKATDQREEVSNPMSLSPCQRQMASPVPAAHLIAHEPFPAS